MARAPLTQLLKVLVDVKPTTKTSDVLVLAGLPRRRKGCDWRLVEVVSAKDFKAVAGFDLDNWLEDIRRREHAIRKMRRDQRHDHSADLSCALIIARCDLAMIRQVCDQWVTKMGVSLSDGVAYVHANAERMDFVVNPPKGGV